MAPTEKLSNPVLTVIVGLGCERTCDFSGRMDIVEPTTGRIAGYARFCKTCGTISGPPLELQTK